MKIPLQFWSWTETIHPPFTPLSPDIPAMAWCAPIPPDGGTLRDQLGSLLSSEEHARLSRLRQPADQLRFLSGRALLRQIAGALLRLPPASLVITPDSSGKPFLRLSPGTPPLHFNLSHSGDLVLAAFSETRSVGIDVERIDPATDCPAVADRIFPPDVHSAWLAAPPETRRHAFFQLWTRHEARLKALGHGFAQEVPPAALAALRCFDLQLPPGYTGALALA